MKKRQSKAKKTVKQAALPKAAEPPARQPGQSNTKVIPRLADTAEKREVCKRIYLDLLGAKVLKKQTAFAIGEDDTATQVAEAFVAAMKGSVKPRDGIEEMLLLQMAWTHARLAKLSQLAVDQTVAVNVRVVNDACDRATNTFRRQMLALAEYRRPPQVAGFLAIKQANVANQQVVQNVENQNASPNFRNPAASNEQGSAPALPTVAEGAGIPAGDGPAKQAMAAQHGPQDGDGQGKIKAERDEARRE